MQLSFAPIIQTFIRFSKLYYYRTSLYSPHSSDSVNCIIVELHCIHLDSVNCIPHSTCSRAFNLSTPYNWNSLPASHRTISSTNSFKRHLKTPSGVNPKWRKVVLLFSSLLIINYFHHKSIWTTDCLVTVVVFKILK